MCMQETTTFDTASKALLHLGNSNLHSYYSVLISNHSARTQCGPQEIAIGDIIVIDFSVLVVHGIHNKERALRMINILHGVHIINKLPQTNVSVGQ